MDRARLSGSRRLAAAFQDRGCFDWNRGPDSEGRFAIFCNRGLDSFPDWPVEGQGGGLARLMKAKFAGVREAGREQTDKQAGVGRQGRVPFRRLHRFGRGLLDFRRHCG